MISKRTLERARNDLRIPTQKRGADWWISLPEHEGDLRDKTMILKGETLSPAKTAKSANPVSTGGDGGLGGVESGTLHLLPLIGETT